MSVLPSRDEGVLSDFLRDIKPTCAVESDSYQGTAIALDGFSECDVGEQVRLAAVLLL